MKVYTNQGYITRRASIGRWSSILGLVVLLGGFVVSLRDPNLFYVSFVTLIVGFVLSNVGIYYANRYVRPDRPDAVLAQALKGFDKRYALYQFLLPVSQVLREPGGLTVFVLKPQEGLITYQGGKWRNKQGWSRIIRWVGQEGLGNPETEVERATGRMQDWLREQAPDLTVPVRGAVLFTHPNAQLELDAPPITSLEPKQVKGWLRRGGKLSPLPDETFDRLCQVLNSAADVGESEGDE